MYFNINIQLILLVPLNSDKVIEIIRNEICNPDLNVDFLCRELSKSRSTVNKCIINDFNVRPSELIKNIKIQRILKYTYDFQIDIYKSAQYYGIVRADSFYKIIKRKFDKNPTDIEFELITHIERRQYFLNYHKSLMINGLII